MKQHELRRRMAAAEGGGQIAPVFRRGRPLRRLMRFRRALNAASGAAVLLLTIPGSAYAVTVYDENLASCSPATSVRAI